MNFVTYRVVDQVQNCYDLFFHCIDPYFSPRIAMAPFCSVCTALYLPILASPYLLPRRDLLSSVLRAVLGAISVAPSGRSVVNRPSNRLNQRKALSARTSAEAILSLKNWELIHLSIFGQWFCKQKESVCDTLINSLL